MENFLKVDLLIFTLKGIYTVYSSIYRPPVLVNNFSDYEGEWSGCEE